MSTKKSKILRDALFNSGCGSKVVDIPSLGRVKILQLSLNDAEALNKVYSDEKRSYGYRTAALLQARVRDEDDELLFEDEKDMHLFGDSAGANSPLIVALITAISDYDAEVSGKAKADAKN